MIRKLTVHKVASYNDEPVVIDGLTQISFFFGSNGSGKTTLSKIINSVESYQNCLIEWENGTPLQTLVYNKDFRERTLEHPKGLPGVFTLGEDHSETLRQIEVLEAQKQTLENKLLSYSNMLNSSGANQGKNQELNELEEEFKEECWKMKTFHDSSFTKVFEGFRNSKEKFKAQILTKINTSTPSDTLDTLLSKYREVFQEDPIKEIEVPLIDTTIIAQIENDPLLSKVIVGRKDVDVAALIDKLNASDWVKEGLDEYYPDSEGVCPFCQQTTTIKLVEDLNQYFDESYINSVNRLKALLEEYRSETTQLSAKVKSYTTDYQLRISEGPIKGLLEKFQVDANNNLTLIEGKIAEPSKRLELLSLEETLIAINGHLSTSNEMIKSHNEMVDSISDAREQLKERIWKYLTGTELKAVIQSFSKRKDSLVKAINSLNHKSKTERESIETIVSQIAELRKQTSSVQPTIDEINKTLNSFGFTGFKLDKTDDGQYYQIIRENRSDAKDTLSEGELSFVSFLYFYCLVKGTLNEASVPLDRILVFDDPVSSLDNDVLFIVSSLLRQIIRDSTKDGSKIKQVIMLTHNIYFFRQVTFIKPSERISQSLFSYWVVSKKQSHSCVRKSLQNPIKSSYQLLWDELKNNDAANHQVIPNIMRRIIEFYFKILGDVSLDDLADRFDGREKQIFESLISWVNAGSHNVFDDAYYDIAEDEISTYKAVFKAVFTHTNHTAHYKMMMGE